MIDTKPVKTEKSAIRKNSKLEISEIKPSQVQSKSQMLSISELVEVIQKERKLTIKKACRMHFPSVMSCSFTREQYIFSQSLISKNYKVSSNARLGKNFTVFSLLCFR